MGKVVVAAVVAAGVGGILAHVLASALGTKAEVAALGVTGLTLLGAGRLLHPRPERLAADDPPPSSLGPGVKVPA